MFTVSALFAGAVAAYIVGVSKTGIPGGGLLAIPLFATVFEGRLITGATPPVLMFADLFAIAWYRQHARWDLLKPLAVWVGLGYAFGDRLLHHRRHRHPLARRPIEVALTHRPPRAM